MLVNKVLPPVEHESGRMQLTHGLQHLLRMLKPAQGEAVRVRYIA
jgi:hypothetical protein